VFAVRLEERC